MKNMDITHYDDFKTFAKYIDLPEIRFNKIMKFIEDSYLKIEELINKSFLSQKQKGLYRNYKDRMKRLGIKVELLI